MGKSPDTLQLQQLLDQGDEQAYDELLSIASVRLHKLARKMLRDYPRLRRWEQTDDVFQTAALRLHRSLAEVKPESVRQFFGLAATQIRRTLIDLARHHFGPEAHGPKHESGADNQPRETEAPETLASWAEFHEQVDQLPHDEREVFQLLWYSGTTQREAAELLNISERTVLRRYCRARLHLQSTFHGADE
ncbi:MAG: sigma-70 family RNA polymerase sigma factor [Planctomycetaceae bacterium]|nr:sigma-70 family RNA polymerase sigma factor [Planctomycetaceae bacterium]